VNTFADRSREPQSRANAVVQERDGGDSASQLVEQRPGATAQRALDESLNQSPKVQSQLQLQQMFNGSSRVAAQRKLADTLSAGKSAQPPQQALQRQETLEEEDEEPLQGKLMPLQKEATLEDEEPLQPKSEPMQQQENKTGLPDNLKAGVENLSGLAMDDVKVHYNSPAPATVQALAYTQGTDIHVGPGQEQHLAHEAWHVAQQKQGRVQPTTQAKGVAINDDKGLESEADAMGARALQAGEMNVQRQAASDAAAETSLIQAASQESQSADTLQLQPEGTYEDGPPDEDEGFEWDTAETTDDGGETVPEHLIAVMNYPDNGGVPSVDPPGWDWLRRKFGRLKGQWVRFHLINAQLGGPGNDTENLVPTTNALNQNGGWRNLEDAAKSSANTDKDWTYLEVEVEYHDEYPAGIPYKINANWGYWKEPDSDGGQDSMEEEAEWVHVSSVGPLTQANPDDDGEANNYLPGTQITLGMLRGYGLSADQAGVAKGLIDRTWADQNAFDLAWAQVPGHLQNNRWDDALERMYVEEDEDIAGPYIVVVKTT
jgi:Domain of unknown function (DUF4157)/DNA/RNA non-specific endonuclease